MKKILISCLIIVSILLLSLKWIKPIFEKQNVTGTIIYKDNNYITIQDKKNIIYTLKNNFIKENIGSIINIEYKGNLNKNTQYQDIEIIDYNLLTKTDNEIPIYWLDNGLFSDFYAKAYEKLKTLSLDEKIGQLFLVRLPDYHASEILKKYQFGGYLFFQKDFADKTQNEVKSMINDLQQASNIPLLTAVDEEGGKVTRISSNSNLVNSKFKSPRELYLSGGLDAIKKDTINKSKILYNLGLNLNLAPVVDVSTNPDDYIYERTLGEDSQTTSKYSEAVIKASKQTNLSYTLKHFPGYGNNKDTHNQSSIDTRTYQELIENDLLPFKTGIEAGAEAVMVSHNIVEAIDADNPASLSSSIHNLLRNELNFTGIIITDDLDMGAVSTNKNATLEAILAGNDLIITTDYELSINSIKQALNDNIISVELIDKLVFRIIAWKYYKNLIT